MWRCSMTKWQLQNLTKSDTYSLILFCLYQLKKDQKVSGLSELIYLLDEQSLLSLCKYYGGLTITIPTLDELQTLIYALVLYESININNKTYDQAIKELNCEDTIKEEVINQYASVCEILKNYKINE